MPSRRRTRRERNLAKKIAKLNDLMMTVVLTSHKILNVSSVTVFKKQLKKRRLARRSATKPILRVRRKA